MTRIPRSIIFALAAGAVLACRSDGAEQLVAPSFHETKNQHVCRGDDVLTPWTIGEAPDQNACGYVCAKLVPKGYYDDRHHEHGLKR